MTTILPAPEYGSPTTSDSRPDLADIPLARPQVPNPGLVLEDIARILASGTLTNGPYVRELEGRAAEYLGVRHCVAVASCTAGLMLLLKAADLTGDVIVPSFTFAATAHAVAWNGLRPVFADVDPSTLTLSPDSVARAIGVRTSAILATHVFGTPCDVEGLEQLAERNGVRLFFDAAHAFGSLRQGVPVGRFGDGEVFSLSPTKVLVAGEGGIIATDDDILAERCRVGRDYGNPGDYNCRFIGLNARMSEVHAAIALNSLSALTERVERRNALAAMYREALSNIPGLTLLHVMDGDRSTYKDFTVAVDPDGFGLDADGLGRALAAVGIETRRYYSPPVHAMQAYRWLAGGNWDLRVTEAAASQTLTLPLWVGMTDAHIAHVAGTIGRIRHYVGSRPF